MEERNTMALQPFLNLAELSLPFLLLLLVSLFVLRLKLAPSKQLHSPLPPSPPGIPILGNLHQLGSLAHRSLCALSKKHGPLMLLHLGQVPTLVVSSAVGACEIMKNHDLIFANRPRFMVAEVVLYKSTSVAFVSYGEYWRNVKKLYSRHLLSPKMVRSFCEIRDEEVGLMIDNISSQASTVINLTEVLNTFANDYLCRVVSGKFTSERQNIILRELKEEVSALFGTFNVGDYIPYLGWIDVFIGLKARAQRNSKGWDDVLDDLIADHANRARGDRIEDVDFVDILLSVQKESNIDFQLTKDNIKAILVDMFFAGTDASYIVLEWAMAELVRNPKAMKKLQDEVRGITSGKSRVQEEDLSEMSYLKSVLKEVFRLHPPVPLLVQRESTEECEIQGYRIPNKARVIVNAWAISRDPKYWEAAEEFCPERFVGSPIDLKGNDFQFTPFGAGRRMCPGMHFAWATTELALANLVKAFDWELPPGITIKNLDMTEAPGITTNKKHKLELSFKPCSL